MLYLPNLLYTISIFRYNDFQNDPVANVSGCDHKTPAGSLANRLDLSDPNSTCAFGAIDDMVGHSAYGALDAKLACKKSFPKLDFTAVAGPTHDQHPPFSWATTNLSEDKPKFLPIETFDFTPFHHNWVLNKAQGLKLR